MMVWKKGKCLETMVIWGTRVEFQGCKCNVTYGESHFFLFIAGFFMRELQVAPSSSRFLHPENCAYGESKIPIIVTIVYHYLSIYLSIHPSIHPSS